MENLQMLQPESNYFILCFPQPVLYSKSWRTKVIVVYSKVP